MPYITAHDGTRLFYRKSGEGPPVVLMHSWALNSDAWQSQMIELSQQGVGASPMIVEVTAVLTIPLVDMTSIPSPMISTRFCNSLICKR